MGAVAQGSGVGLGFGGKIFAPLGGGPVGSPGLHFKQGVGDVVAAMGGGA